MPFSDERAYVAFADIGLNGNVPLAILTRDLPRPLDTFNGCDLAEGYDFSFWAIQYDTTDAFGIHPILLAEELERLVREANQG